MHTLGSFCRSLRSTVIAVAIALLAVAALGARDAVALTRCVTPGGVGGCFASIQAAVDASENRDVVTVDDGTYVENVTIPARKRFISIQGDVTGGAIIVAADPLRPTLSVYGGATRATITDLELRGGQAGAYVSPAAYVNFFGVDLTGNTVGLENHGKTWLSASNVVDNAELGILTASRGSSLTVHSSTIAGNGTGGVGIASDSKTKVINSTISGNGGFGIGSGAATVEASTITDNASGGIDVARRATVRTSIIAGNGAPGSDCQTQSGAKLRVAAPTLFGDVGSCALIAPPANLLIGDPLLGPLQNNGLKTETHALLPGSPAIGVLTRKPLCRLPDQRGVQRSVPCDLGAYEAP
jgi:hypothetical protein